MAQATLFGAGVHPDLPTSFVHFTGRPRATNDKPPAFAPAGPDQRLVRILQEGFLRAAPTFGTRGPVLCVSESTDAAIRVMLNTGVTTRGPYAPWALLLDRAALVGREFRPVWHMSRTEMNATDSLPTIHRDRRVWYEPGRADWLAEREWRRCWGDVPVQDTDPPGLDLAGLLTGVIVERQGWMPPPLVTMRTPPLSFLMYSRVTVTSTKFAGSVDQVPRLWWNGHELKADGVFDLHRQMLEDMIRPWE